MDNEKSLASFLEMVRSNQLANQTNHADWYAIIKTIDDCFVRGGSNLVNPAPVMSGILFLRCQYAFKTAAGLALAGQVTETFVLLRSVLEYAGYALLIHDNPALQDIWLGRHVSPEAKRAQKDAFKISDRIDHGTSRARTRQSIDELHPQPCRSAPPLVATPLSVVTLQPPGSSLSGG